MGNKNLRNILIYSIAGVFLLNVIWGNGYFDLGKIKAFNSQNTGIKQTKVSAASSTIYVSTHPAVNTVVTSQAATMATGCKISLADINLNQPADCFSLSIDESHPALAHLVVRPLYTSQQVVIIPFNQKISSPGLLPGSSDAAGIPTLPAVL